jgi:hypothetical protein
MRDAMGGGQSSLTSSAIGLVIISLLSINSLAQRPTGRITGRVMTDDGQPLTYTMVSVVGVGSSRRGSGGGNSIITDEDGNFQADGLDPIPYTIRVYAPGYVIAPNSKASDLFDQRARSYSYIGDSVTITMTKGAVITGKVINTAGEPVIGIGISAIRTRDEDGHPVNEQRRDFIFPHSTDDRGVYRIYGLPPGSYVVSAGGGNRVFLSGATPFGGKMTIFHPSSTRETANEITVRAGEEVSGVDIRYRSERGFSISGTVSGSTSGRLQVPGNVSTRVSLKNLVTGNLVDTAFVQPVVDNNGYAFYGLPNGEYEITAARSGMDDDNSTVSPPKRVVINGRDIGGIDLVLTPTGSLAGRMVLEKAQETAGLRKCESKRGSFLDEVALWPRVGEPAEKVDSRFSLFGGQPVVVPNDKGNFIIRNLVAGRYRIEPQLPDENWYVKTMTVTGSSTSQPFRTVPQNQIKATTGDIARSGILLKSGEEKSGITVTIATGAAGLKGKVVAAEDIKLPSRLRIHLLPAEPEAKDDLLRFAENRAESDGSFNFGNLSPGKYLLVTRTVPDTEKNDDSPRPVAWDNNERAKLRKEAEAANLMIELKSCQRVTDYALRFAKKRGDNGTNGNN